MERRPNDRPRTPVLSSPPIRSQSTKAINVRRSPQRFRTQMPQSTSGTSSARGSHQTRSRRQRTADEMRIQVHDDGMVEFSVMLGAHVDASHLATLVNAVRSSAPKDNSKNVKPTTPSMARIDATLQQHPNGGNPGLPNTVSSPDLKSLIRPPIRRATSSMPRSFEPMRSYEPVKPQSPPLRSPQSPRLPDRSGLHEPGSPLSLTANPSDSPTNRSVSQPELGRNKNSQILAPLSLRHTSMLEQVKANDALLTTDESGDALMHDVPPISFDENDRSYIPPHQFRPLPPSGEPRAGTSPEGFGNSWTDADYDVTSPYRTSNAIPPYRQSDAPPPTKFDETKNEGRRSFTMTEKNQKPNPAAGTRGRWRLLQRMVRGRNRKTPVKTMEDRKPSDSKLSNDTGKRGRRAGGSGSLGGILEGSDGAVPGDEWLEFSTLMSRDQALNEITRFAKLRGNQVWRRPGEQKLRCIRKISKTEEMHMVVVIEAHPTTGGTLVRVRRARGDRGRTEWWRYMRFYKDLMTRLSGQGHSILELQKNAAHGVIIS